MARSKRSEAIARGWIPDQHGAWGMALAPLLVGLILAGRYHELAWVHLAISVAWISGFFAFSVLEKWVKSRRRTRYQQALATYGGISCVSTLAAISINYQLLWWAVVFAPLLTLSLVLMWQRRERTLLARASIIVAATTITWVALSASQTAPWFASGVIGPRAWLTGVVLAMYFLLTVPYVKTLIRERGSRPWLLGSVAGHTVAMGAVVGLCFLAPSTFKVTWVTVIVWVVLWARAIWMPWAAERNGKPWRPAVVGILETVLSLFVMVSLPW